MNIAYKLMRPLLFKMDAEKAHELTLSALKKNITPCVKQISSSSLSTDLWGKTFKTPIGLAAGFDKNAEVLSPMLKMGFSFVEAGTVTPLPQEGNPRPRVFRSIENNAVINRMGFPNKGLDYFKNNLQNYRANKNAPKGIIGLNIGMNKTQSAPEKDYLYLAKELAPLADYLTVNISSPNTPGLRDLQKAAFLKELIDQLKEQIGSVAPHNPPLLVKLAPDLQPAQIEELADLALNSQLDGLILTNTTLERPENLPPSFSAQAGGLSGQPAQKKSTETIRAFYKHTKGKVPIIGLGGIHDAASAYEKIKAGANLLQLYSALVFQGPAVLYTINHGLKTLLEDDGFTSIQEAVGCEVD